MFTIKKIKEIDFKKYKDYKLCYIDEIPRTVYDYFPGVREKYKEVLSLPYEQYQNEIWKYPECRMQELPNEDYIAGECELWAYFTPIDLNEQWGDDWNDAPYECNAEVPYDDIIDETKESECGLKVVTKSHDYEILQVPFAVHSNDYKLPKDYCNQGNSHFCVRDINRQAVAWIYDFNYHNDKSVAILAGCSPKQFVKQLKEIDKNNPNYKPYDEEDY